MGSKGERIRVGIVRVPMARAGVSVPAGSCKFTRLMVRQMLCVLAHGGACGLRVAGRHIGSTFLVAALKNGCVPQRSARLESVID